jgi:uncharacterized protein (TIGR02285 family)
MLARSIAPSVQRAVLCGALLGGGAARSTETTELAAVRVHYLPGIELSAEGVPRVPMAERVGRWMVDAGLRVRWEPVPLKRSLFELQANTEPVCVLGAFRTPERERFMQFSAPIHLEAPHVFIAQVSVAERLRAHGDARKALNDPKLRLLVYDGVSYGSQLDRWIAERPEVPLRALAGRARALEMLARGRADWMIGTADELRDMLATGAAAGAPPFEVVQLPGMPPAVTRHLACSQQVPGEWMQRLDRAMKARPL